MSATAAPILKTRMTPDEYLAFERASEERHEYVNGEVVAMAGGTKRHGTLLHQALRGHRCQAYPADVKVHIPATGNYRYPDVSLACDPEMIEDADDDTSDILLNACVLFEVLSDSTEKTDRGEKFQEYRSIPTFTEYVLVSQHRVMVEHYTRQADGTWTLRFLPAGETLRLSCAKVEIAVNDLYERVKFSVT